MRLAIVLAAVITSLAACSDARGTSGGTDIPPQDPELVAEGEVLYSSNCASCHGPDLKGTDQGPSPLSEVYEPGHHGDAAFFQAVRFGSPAHHWDFGDMPPVEGLEDEDIEAIVAFVRESQRTSGFEPYPP